MQDPIFTRIIKGEIPCHKVYEDQYVIAFLDIHPVQPGHTLVVPKKQVEFLWDLDQQTYDQVTGAAKKIALHLREVMGVPYIGEQVIGYDVPHAHIHLIPFTQVKDFRNHPDMTADPDHEFLAGIAGKIRLDD